MSVKKNSKAMRTLVILGWMLAGLFGAMATGCAQQVPTNPPALTSPSPHP